MALHGPLFLLLSHNLLTFSCITLSHDHFLVTTLLLSQFSISHLLLTLVLRLPALDFSIAA